MVANKFPLIDLLVVMTEIYDRYPDAMLCRELFSNDGSPTGNLRIIDNGVYVGLLYTRPIFVTWFFNPDPEEE